MKVDERVRVPSRARTGCSRIMGFEKSASHFVSITVHVPVMRSRTSKARTPAAMSMSMLSVAALFSLVELSTTSWRFVSAICSCRRNARVSDTMFARWRMCASSCRTPSMLFFKSRTRIESCPARSAICSRV